MRKTSLADAKAHLSALVDEAEHHGRRTLILRHGKPAAAIVPAHAVVAKLKRRKKLSARQIAELFRRLEASPGPSAVDDLLAGRR